MVSGVAGSLLRFVLLSWNKFWRNNSFT